MVVDGDDIKKIKKISQKLEIISGYASFRKTTNGKTKITYLHNYIYGKHDKYNAKGKKYTLDHINRVKLDNRKKNLKLSTQTEQNINQSKRDRVVVFPEDCDVDANDMPKNVYYSSGDKRFVIDIKHEGKRMFYENQTRSSKYSIKEKLVATIKRLIVLRNIRPDLKNRIKLNTYDENQLKLIKQYNTIIELSGYRSYKTNKIIVSENNNIATNVVLDKKLEDSVINKVAGRNISTLPPDCGVTLDMIPAKCQYRKATKEKGDYFIIENHPDLKGKRSIMTQCTREFSTIQKYDMLLAMLEDLKAGIVE